MTKQKEKEKENKKEKTKQNKTKRKNKILFIKYKIIKRSVRSKIPFSWHIKRIYLLFIMM